MGPGILSESLLGGDPETDGCSGWAGKYEPDARNAVSSVGIAGVRTMFCAGQAGTANVGFSRAGAPCSANDCLRESILGGETEGGKGTTGGWVANEWTWENDGREEGGRRGALKKLRAADGSFSRYAGSCKGMVCLRGLRDLFQSRLISRSGPGAITHGHRLRCRTRTMKPPCSYVQHSKSLCRSPSWGVGQEVLVLMHSHPDCRAL